MGKILVSASHFHTLCKEAWALLEQHGHEVIYDPKREFPAYSAEELKKLLPGVDGALIGLDFYTEEIFRNAPELKVVAKFGVGTDNIDLDAASSHGVKVVNAPGMNSNSVAELTVCCMLGLLRCVVPLHQKMEKGLWPRYVGSELQGKTVGLLGFGAISKSVAKKLSAFDAKVLAYDLYPDYQSAEQLGVTLTSMDEIIIQSDIISLHIPSSRETYHLFNKETFSRMKKGSYLINAARGPLVDLDDLCDALRQGQLAGAALDAFEAEPLPADSPIFGCENVILTPHTGGETEEAYRRISLSACADICAVLEGKEPVHWVNKK